MCIWHRCLLVGYFMVGYLCWLWNLKLYLYVLEKSFHNWSAGMFGKGSRSDILNSWWHFCTFLHPCWDGYNNHLWQVVSKNVVRYSFSQIFLYVLCVFEVNIGIPNLVLQYINTSTAVCGLKGCKNRKCSIFTERCSYASTVLGVVILSVCPSIRLSHACFVTNPKNLPAIFLHHMKGQSF